MSNLITRWQRAEETAPLLHKHEDLTPPETTQEAQDEDEAHSPYTGRMGQEDAQGFWPASLAYSLRSYSEDLGVPLKRAWWTTSEKDT